MEQRETSPSQGPWVRRACPGRPACFEMWRQGQVGSSRPKEAEKGHLGLRHLCVYLRDWSLLGGVPGFLSGYLGLSATLCVCHFGHVSLELCLCVCHPPSDSSSSTPRPGGGQGRTRPGYAEQGRVSSPAELRGAPPYSGPGPCQLRWERK